MIRTSGKFYANIKYLTAENGCSCNIRGITTATKMRTTHILRFILFLFVHTVTAFTSEKTYQNAIKFLYFNERFEFIVRVIFANLRNVFPSRNESIIQPNNSTITSQCKVDEKAKLAIIIHGWMESCETIWVTTLMQSEWNVPSSWKSFNELMILRFEYLPSRMHCLYGLLIFLEEFKLLCVGSWL